MYDYHHSTLPNALSNIFQNTGNIDIHNHYTRQYTHHHIKSHRTALASKSIIHTGPKEWNTEYRIQNLLSNFQYTYMIQYNTMILFITDNTYYYN